MDGSLISACLILAGIGLFFGLLLSVAKIKLYVEKDARIDLIKEALPGANCGACGFPGCAGYATKIVMENSKMSLCPVGGSETVGKIAAIMGTDSVETITPLTARIHCHGGNAVTTQRFTYSGPKSCVAANDTMGGSKTCSFGCLGFGDCVSACLFDAIHMGKNGIPIVDLDKCTGCNNCVIECPRNIIELVPASIETVVLCKNTEKLSAMKKGCSVGCTGCKLCEKNCPEAAITITSFCASIDYLKCNNCMKCVEVCSIPVIHPIEKSKKYQETLNPTVKVPTNKDLSPNVQDEAV